MQRLKKILILIFMLIAFSLICVGIVNADTTIYNGSVYRQDDFVNLLKNNESLFQNQINFDNDIVAISYNSNDTKYIVYTITRDMVINNNNGYFEYGGNYCVVYPNSDYTSIINSNCYGYYYPNTSFISTFFVNYFVSEFGQNSTIKIINNSSNNWTFTNSDNNNSSITLNTNSQLDLIDVVYALNDYSVSPPVVKCDPSHFLGKFSNVSSFDVTIKSNTNVLKGVVDGAFDIISSSYMTENDWDITYTSNDDEIIHAGSLSCITNRCVFRYQAGVEDDIDTDIILNYHFEPVSGVSMPTTIQIDTCYDSDFYINTIYSYVNDDSNNNGNVVIPSTDNFLQDGTLPNIGGLSNTDIIPDGPVDSILLLPLNIMQSLLNILNSSTCSPVVVPIPFSNSNLSLPCISTIYSKIGAIEPMFTSFLTWFSAIVSAFILYQYFIYLYKWVDDTLTFRENNHFGGY